MSDAKFRLTRLSSGGAKIAPGMLRSLLGQVAPKALPSALLVGHESNDDAAVFQINRDQAIVATTDFLPPLIDDPFDFGRIAATHAISDIYAMGATPLFALAIVGMPINSLPIEAIASILRGGEAVCQAAHIPLAGGHSIDLPEPLYGLAAVGLVNPAHLKRNASARSGDLLVLGKPLGVGIYSSAFAQDKLHQSDYAALIDSTTQLNTPGPMLSCLDGVHAVTDVTGSGLIGHLLEICHGSHTRAVLRLDDLPLLPRVHELIEAGLGLEAAERNWSAYGADVAQSSGLSPVQRALLGDPQTSGGLLVSCAPECLTEVLSIFLQQGFPHVSVIGEMLEGAPGIDLR